MWSPTSGMSSSRQAICQTRFHTFSTSRWWNSAVVYRSTGTRSGPPSIGDWRRNTSGVGRLSPSSSAWYSAPFVSAESDEVSSRRRDGDGDAVGCPW